MWGSSVPSGRHRLQAAIPAGRAIPQGAGRESGRCRWGMLSSASSFIQTLTAPLSRITKSPDPWVLTSQHSHLDSQGSHLPGQFKHYKVFLPEPRNAGSDSQAGTTPSVAPALGTKLHPSQIPSPAADTQRAGDLWERWQHGGDRGTPQPSPLLGSETSPSLEGPQHPLVAPHSSQDPSRFSDAPFHSAPRTAKS